jgi:hypothetical protein
MAKVTGKKANIKKNISVKNGKNIKGDKKSSKVLQTTKLIAKKKDLAVEVIKAEKVVKSDAKIVLKTGTGGTSKSPVSSNAKAIKGAEQKPLKVKLSKATVVEPVILKEPPVVENVVDHHVKPRKVSKKNQAIFQAGSDEEAKWHDLKEKYRGNQPFPYKMSEIYQEKTLLDHKVLGLGVILSVVNDRLEVLFQTGTKHLISNYKK